MVAMAHAIQGLMATFEHEQLHHHTPCRFTSRKAIAQALAEVHVELMLIHPFHEGNGRVGRMLATLMGLQAGLPLLNFNVMAGDRKEEYFAAVPVGVDRDYRPMTEIFADIIELSS
jgi:cell filamentation protein